MADFNRTRPVDEMIAEGFGTLTHKPDGIADGRGEWRDGRWHVVFVGQLQTMNLSSAVSRGRIQASSALRVGRRCRQRRRPKTLFVLGAV
jgi:hypothetical protein